MIKNQIPEDIINKEFVPFSLFDYDEKGEFECLNQILSNKPQLNKQGIPYKIIRTKNNCRYLRFLYEFDSLSLKEQENFINNLKIPTYRITYSGKKSYHIILQINNEPETDLQYKFAWEYMRSLFKFYDCDGQCCDNSRLTRRPGIIRKDTGKEQKLLSFNKGIVNINWKPGFILYEKQMKQKKSEYKKLIDLNNPISKIEDFFNKNMKRIINWNEGSRHLMAAKFYGITRKEGYKPQEIVEYLNSIEELKDDPTITSSLYELEDK